MDDTAFFAAATEVINDLERELSRVPPEARANWRALDFDCGSGRLARAMSRHFSEIWAAEAPGSPCRPSVLLSEVPNVRLAAIQEGLIPEVATESVDFAYSWNRLQQSAGRGSVLSALQEIWRVLKPGGLARLQFNGPQTGAAAVDPPRNDGFSSHDLLEIAAKHDFQLLGLERYGSGALRTTLRKRKNRRVVDRGSSGHEDATPQSETSRGVAQTTVAIRRITNASSWEPVAPCRGRFASIVIRAENLPDDAGLNELRVTIGSSLGTITYIGPRERSGCVPIHADLPELESTGLLPVQLLWLDRPISAPATLRVIPPGPLVPRVVAIGDRPVNVDLNHPDSLGHDSLGHASAAGRADRRTIRLSLEEIANPYDLEAFVDSMPALGFEYVCTSPREQRFDVKFSVPDEVPAGTHRVEIRAGKRRLTQLMIEVVE